MGVSVNPTLLDRLSRLVRPDFARTVLARRVAAGLLIALAGVAALRPDATTESRDVVVTVRDLGPGITLGTADVALIRRPGSTVPDGALTSPEAAVGATLAGPSRRGEVLTDARVLGARQATLSAGPDARNVPVHLAESAVLEVIRSGDIVDVLGAPTADVAARPRLLASDAVVVLISPPGQDRVVLLALPARAANALAAASLVQSLTVTVH